MMSPLMVSLYLSFLQISFYLESAQWGTFLPLVFSVFDYIRRSELSQMGVGGCALCVCMCVREQEHTCLCRDVHMCR